MNMRDKVENIYVRAYVMSKEDGKSTSQAKSDAMRAVKEAGYYLDGGVWKKTSGKVSPRKRIEVDDRSNENKQLSMIRVNTRMA